MLYSIDFRLQNIGALPLAIQRILSDPIFYISHSINTSAPASRSNIWGGAIKSGPLIWGPNPTAGAKSHVGNGRDRGGNICAIAERCRPEILYNPTLYLFRFEPSEPTYRRIYNEMGPSDPKCLQTALLSYFGSAILEPPFSLCTGPLRIRKLYMLPL